MLNEKKITFWASEFFTFFLLNFTQGKRPVSPKLEGYIKMIMINEFVIMRKRKMGNN